MSKLQIKRSTLRSRTLSLIQWREHLTGYIFLAPSLLLFGVFLFYPLLKTIYLSFQTTDPTGKVVKFAGLANYSELFRTAEFMNSLKVTALFSLYTVPAGIILALLLGVLTHSKAKGMKGFQFIFSLPISISVGTGAIIWMMLFHPSMGTLNYFLHLMGFHPIFWLSDPHWALISVSLMTVWMNLGFNYIVLLGGIKGIPDDILDSAKIDGVGPIRQLFNITIPLLSPTLFFLLIVSMISSFQAFGQVNIMTSGGPMQRTNVVVFQVYQEAFVNFHFGSGSAQALILFAIIFVMTLIQFTVLERKVHYQ
ncbi:MAG: glycerol-3-phosphate ABC transporter permease [Paenibacillus sp. RIFOXYA1_FULL_44_5]|nr:MAG: glycerol-3-phosphate ABC transporter permease [Paenibacillus sp. RIFOXYA1_FULL_44_5]